MIGVEKDNQPSYGEPPHRTSTPPIDTFHPSSNGVAEMYHLKVADDNNDIPNHRSSPGFVNNNRITPAPPLLLPAHLNSSEQGPEMYYLQADNDATQPISSIGDSYLPHSRLNDAFIHEETVDSHKATIYMLTSTEDENQENLPRSPSTRLQRTPSSPIRPTKKQQPISYEIVDNATKLDVKPKQRPFPTALGEATPNIPYVPLTHSKASESIQRSMNKYRFGGN